MTKKATTRWARQTTMEKLENFDYAIKGAVLKHGEQVLVVGFEGRGYHAAVYEFVDTPEETGLADIECRLNLIAMSGQTFEDGGHAISWAMSQN